MAGRWVLGSLLLLWHAVLRDRRWLVWTNFVRSFIGDRRLAIAILWGRHCNGSQWLQTNLCLKVGEMVPPANTRTE